MNNLQFVKTVFKLLNSNKIEVWLIGGWAEELQGLIKPRKHKDIDLLYVGENFAQIDSFLNKNQEKLHIVKNFSHKRAFLFKNIMIEIILVNQKNGEFVTNYFNSFLLNWPKNTFENGNSGKSLNMVSEKVLTFYRENHKMIEGAYAGSGLP
jgi:hypothetical protein